MRGRVSVVLQAERPHRTTSLAKVWPPSGLLDAYGGSLDLRSFCSAGPRTALGELPSASHARSQEAHSPEVE